MVFAMYRFGQSAWVSTRRRGINWIIWCRLWKLVTCCCRRLLSVILVLLTNCNR